jgi:ADP-ribosylglycohydrolase/catechol 2,3-dioxygenase-like lactoylglutathione lyase family enzyme
MPNPLRLTDSIDRARAPMLGAAIGDALGWPMENRSGRVGGISKVEPRFELTAWRRREGGGYAPHEVAVPAGTYSDDTQLTLAVGRSRLRGDRWWEHWSQCELPLWLVYERGGGGATKRAAQAWNRGHGPWSREAKERDRERYYEAGGNGVAMRILPHALIETADFKTIAREILADGICTHGHPRALIGAQVQAYAIWLALNLEGPLGYGDLLRRALDEEDSWGYLAQDDERLSGWWEATHEYRPDFVTTWKRTRGEARRLLEGCQESLGEGSLAVDRKTLEKLGAFDPKVSGSGTVTAAASVFLASRYASRPEHGMLAAAFARGADTDTVAAMTGAILGAVDRDDWLAGIDQHLQDLGYIEDLSAALSRGESTRLPGSSWRADDRRTLWPELEAAPLGSRLPLSIFGSVEVRGRENIPTRSSNQIIEWTLLTEEGLTLHPKRVASEKAAQRRTAAEAGPSVAASEDPSKIDGTPFWLVLSVADLDASRQFFDQSLGLNVREDKARRLLYVFDRIVLEQSDRTTSGMKFSDEEDLIRHPSAVTIFRSEHQFAALQGRLEGAGVPTTGVFDRHGRRAFRTADPDGNVFEFRLNA